MYILFDNNNLVDQIFSDCHTNYSSSQAQKNMATVANYLGNAAWVKRIEQLYADSYDLNENGYLTKEDFHTSINKLALKVTDHPELIDKLWKSTVEFTDALGLSEGVKADKKMLLKLLAAFVVGEKAKMDKGKETLIQKHNVALFDVVDRNHDGNLGWHYNKIDIS